MATTATTPTALKSTTALPGVTKLLSITQHTTLQYNAANMPTIVSQTQPLSMVTATQSKAVTEITPTLSVVTSTPCQPPVPAIDPLPMVTSTIINTDKTTGSSQVPTVQESLSMVMTSKHHSALPQMNQWISPKGDTTLDDMVRDQISTHPYQSLPVFPELTIMVVQKPTTKIQLSQMTSADMDCVTQIEHPPGYSGEKQIETTTVAIATKPSQQQTPESDEGKEKSTPKSLSTLPMVTLTKDVPSPIKHSSEMI